jgi:hypothetical protein
MVFQKSKEFGQKSSNRPNTLGQRTLKRSRASVSHMAPVMQKSKEPGSSGNKYMKRRITNNEISSGANGRGLVASPWLRFLVAGPDDKPGDMRRRTPEPTWNNKPSAATWANHGSTTSALLAGDLNMAAAAGMLAEGATGDVGSRSHPVLSTN